MIPGQRIRDSRVMNDTDQRRAAQSSRAAERIELEADKRAGWVIFVDDRD